MQTPVAQTESPLETGRLVNNLVRIGVVSDVRVEGLARCRVRIDQEETDWLPWVTLRAGGEKEGSFWWPPARGEQVIVLAPGGDLAQAVVLPAIYSDARPPKGEKEHEFRIDWNESDYMKYTHAQLHFQILETSVRITTDSIEMSAAGATLRLDREGLTVSPEVRVGAIRLTEHKHVGVIPGPALTGVPAP